MSFRKNRENGRRGNDQRNSIRKLPITEGFEFVLPNTNAYHYEISYYTWREDLKILWEEEVGHTQSIKNKNGNKMASDLCWKVEGNRTVPSEVGKRLTSKAELYCIHSNFE